MIISSSLRAPTSAPSPGVARHSDEIPRIHGTPQGSLSCRVMEIGMLQRSPSIAAHIRGDLSRHQSAAGGRGKKGETIATSSFANRRPIPHLFLCLDYVRHTSLDDPRRLFRLPDGSASPSPQNSLSSGPFFTLNEGRSRRRRTHRVSGGSRAAPPPLLEASPPPRRTCTATRTGLPAAGTALQP